MYASLTSAHSSLAPLTQPSRVSVRVGLLGHGRVGSAVARLLADSALPGAALAAVLVRRGRSGGPAPFVTSAADLFRTRPDVVIEALGGVEPARTLILAALRRGIPVVTANKSVIARHGDELFAAAARAAVALRCEAAVVAGVPFLGAIGSRPLAASAARIAGILNGTGNVVLSRMERGDRLEDALAEAQARGLAEPDASNDLDGTDAAEKLCVLVRHAWRRSIHPDEIPRTPLTVLAPVDLALAHELDGRIKPAAWAERTATGVRAYAGPAFVPAADPLSALSDVVNAVRFERGSEAPVQFLGPGAGPDVTARTVLDDLHEILGGRAPSTVAPGDPVSVDPPEPGGWFVSLRAARLPAAEHLADLLATYGISPARWSARRSASGGNAQAFRTWRCSAEALHSALASVRRIASASFAAVRVLESPGG